MTTPLSFDDLQAILHQCIAHLPNHRKHSPNTRYTMQDTALDAFGIFFTPSPSFLEYQHRFQASQGRNSVQTLFGVQYIPWDNQIRTLLEQMAGKRWIRHHAHALAPYHVTLLGDDLYSKQPLCAFALEQDFNFIVVYTPDSHPTLYERLAFWQANDGIVACESRHWNGHFTDVSMYRSLNDVLLLDGQEALSVHGFKRTVVNAKTGEQLSHNSWITPHRVTAENVAGIVQAGRGRWKIANENTHVLKSKGYHVAHNFGHG